MKKYIINLIFLILPLYSFSQTVQEQFSGFGNITSVTSLGSSNYTVVLSGFTGSPRFEVNGTWVGSDVAVGDVIFRDGARYVITLVNSSSSGGFNVRINSPDEGLGVSALNPGDIVAVGRESMGLFPIPRQGDNAGTGIPPSLASSIEIHNMKITGNLVGDYITTDSFTTFTNGATFASIPIGKTIYRTTTGNTWRKTGASSVARVTLENGQNAPTILNVNNDTLSFNSNLNNHIRLTVTPTSATTVKINSPANISSQFIGETFMIGITSGNSATTVVWDTVYGKFDLSNLTSTIVPTQTTLNYTFRVISDGAEGIRLQSVDDLGGGSADLSITGHTANQLTVASASGTDATITLATNEGGTNLAGLISPAEKTQLTTQAMGYASSITANFNLGNNVAVTLTGDATINAPTNANLGELISFVFTASGADRTVTFVNTVFKESDGITNIGSEVIISGSTREFTFRVGPAVLHRVSDGGSAGNIKTTSDGSNYTPTGSPTTDEVSLDTRRGAFSQNSTNVTVNNGNLATTPYTQSGTTLSSWNVATHNKAVLTVNSSGNVSFSAVSNLASANVGDIYVLQVNETHGSNHLASWNSNYRESDGTTTLVTDSIRANTNNFFRFIVKTVSGTNYLVADDANIGLSVAKNQIAVGNGSTVTGTSQFTWDGGTLLANKDTDFPVFRLQYRNSSNLPAYKQPIGEIHFGTWLNDGTLRNDDIAQIYAVYQSPGENTESSAIILRTAQVSGTGYNAVFTKDGLFGINTNFLQSSSTSTDSVRARLHVFNYDQANIPGMMFTNQVGGDTTLLFQNGKFGFGLGVRPANTLSVKGPASVGSTYANTTTGNTNGLIVEGNVGVGTTTNTSGYKLDVIGKIRSSDAIETETATITYQGNRIAYWNPSLQNTQIGQLTASLSPTGTANQLFGYQVGSNITSGGSNVGLGYSLFQGLTIGSNNFAFGVSSGANSTTRNNTFCLGRNAVPTANNQFVIGSANYLYSDFYLGYGVTTDQGLFGTNLHGASITGSADASASAGLFTINGARGTGTGVGGDIRFQVAPAAGSTSSTTNSLSEAMRIKQDKKIGVGTTAPDQIFDINLGTAGAFQLTYNDANGSAATYATQTLSSTGVQTFNATGSAAGFTFSDDVTVPTEAYDATGWNGDLTVPTKDAVRDKIESLGGADNLGNHTATQALNMNSFAINNASRVSADSTDILNPGFQNTPTFNYQEYTATGTLNRELAHYWDGTTDDTLTTNSVLPDESLFFVKNNDATLLLTVLAGAGNTMNGDGRIYPGEGIWFQKHGTVIERITPFRRDYRADLSPTTDTNGDFTITHNLGTSNVVYFLTPICDACRYSFRRKTTSGITSNTIVIRVYDESTGTPLASTSLSVSATVQRIN